MKTWITLAKIMTNIKIDNIGGLCSQELLIHFVKMCLSELDINPKKIYICFENEKYIGNTQSTGMCIDNFIDDYTILAAKNNRTITEVFRTVAHELVHIKHYMKDNLSDLFLQEADDNYENLWWEKEARLKSERLIIKFVKNTVDICT